MGWNRDIPAKEILDEAASAVEYGDRSGTLYAVLSKLSEQAIMSWGDTVVYSEVSRGRMPEHNLAEYEERYGKHIRARLAEFERYQCSIDEGQEQLSLLLQNMQERTRLLPFFLMSDGQKLLNRYARHIYEGGENPEVLAEDFECWFREYKNLWHKTSRESELYRLGEVIFWVADTLRNQK